MLVLSTTLANLSVEVIISFHAKRRQCKTRFKWHLFIFYALNDYSLFPYQEALVPESPYCQVLPGETVVVVLYPLPFTSCFPEALAILVC
jgi:hypothetical protein